MTSRRTAPRRLAIFLTVALIAPLAALAQATGTPAAPARGTTSGQAPGPQAAPAQTSPAQPTTSQTAPSQTAPQSAPSAASSQNAPSQTAPSQTAPSQAGAPPGAATAPSFAGAPAQTYSGPAYDIEIVIFRAKAALGEPENWSAETTAGGTVAGGEASSGSGSVGKLLTVLPAANYRLTAIATRLHTSGTYEPVAHAAWVQTASAWGTRTGFTLDSLGINVPGLSGVIYLERGEFLHLGMELNYTMQDPPSGLNAPAGTTFVMNETRRIRFYQRNYYDHPAFGVIALVTPARGPRPPGR